MTIAVTDPSRISDAFALAFNQRNMDDLLALYEHDAVLRVDGGGKDLAGVTAIAEELARFLQVAAVMKSRNNFCVTHGDLALLRVDWEALADDGRIVASGSSAELIRRQPDGRWLYVIDHAVGAGLPRIGGAEDRPA